MYKGALFLLYLLTSLNPCTSSPIDVAENRFQKRATELVGSGIQAKRSENGPVITQNFPDPSVIKVGSTWWAFATQSPDTGINIPMATSSDFETWTVQSSDALPDTPGWVNMTAQALWAPDVSQLDDGSFVMYFSAAPNGNSAYHCIGAATSKTVSGPYVAQSEALFCPLAQGGAIDPDGFNDWQTQGGSGGTRYVVYKVDGNSLGNGNAPNTGNCGNTIDPIAPTPIILQPMKADGVTPSGAATTILNNNGLSDNGLVEAPSLVKSVEGKYVLFFSNGCYSFDDYTTSYATADSITGPYTRQGALLQTGTDGLYSPGGADIFGDASHMVFHSDYPNHNASNRAMYTAIIDIKGDTVTI